MFCGFFPSFIHYNFFKNVGGIGISCQGWNFLLKCLRHTHVDVACWSDECQTQDLILLYSMQRSSHSVPSCLVLLAMFKRHIHIVFTLQWFSAAESGRKQIKPAFGRIRCSQPGRSGKESRFMASNSLPTTWHCMYSALLMGGLLPCYIHLALVITAADCMSTYTSQKFTHLRNY